MSNNRTNALIDLSGGRLTTPSHNELPLIFTTSPAAGVETHRDGDVEDQQASIKFTPRLEEDGRERVSSIDRRIPRGRGRRRADRSRGAAGVHRSPAPLPTRCGYFRFGVRCGLAFVPYSWCSP
jgi:hypothetical protein